MTDHELSCLAAVGVRYGTLSCSFIDNKNMIMNPVFQKTTLSDYFNFVLGVPV